MSQPLETEESVVQTFGRTLYNKNVPGCISLSVVTVACGDAHSALVTREFIQNLRK